MEKMKDETWFVVGGIYTDGTFTRLENGGAELHGPYHDERSAILAHDGLTRKNLDICWHKLYLVKKV